MFPCRPAGIGPIFDLCFVLGPGSTVQTCFCLKIVVYIIFRAIGGLSASCRTWKSASDGAAHSLAYRNRIMFLPKHPCPRKASTSNVRAMVLRDLSRGAQYLTTSTPSSALNNIHLETLINKIACRNWARRRAYRPPPGPLKPETGILRFRDPHHRAGEGGRGNGGRWRATGVTGEEGLGRRRGDGHKEIGTGKEEWGHGERGAGRKGER